MSCGKSTISRMLAEKLGYSLEDTDQLLFRRTGMTLQEMFAKGGEAYFRDLEHAAVQEAATLQRTIIATGGGVMTFERNALLLREHTWVVHIHRPFADCYEAICRRRNRPIAGQKTEAEMHAMYDARVPLYNKYADFVLENTGTAQQAVETLVQWAQEKNIT